MNILAFDTSSRILSVVFWREGNVLAEYESDGMARHSNVLVPAMEKMLRSRRLSLEKIDFIAVGVGPGSFTGLRVGTTVAKILGYALNKKIVGISSLEAMAREAAELTKKERIAVSLDAKKSMAYGAYYLFKGGGLREILRPSLMRTEKFHSKTHGADLVIGNFPGQEYAYPKARWIAESAVHKIRNKKFTDPFRLEPLYLHPRDCNVTRKK